MSIPPPSTPRLDDEDAEIARREFQRFCSAVVMLPAISLVVIKNVVLRNGVATPVAHGFGRTVSVIVSPPRGASSAGVIEDIRDGAVDRKQFVQLLASGWGADITVDLWVM